MRRVRGGAFLGVVLTGAAIAIAASNCATPTQIVIDLRADPSLCPTLFTAIAVTSRDQIDSAGFREYQKGCDGPEDDRVGTLTITPSGAKDAEVAIRIVGAINGLNPDRCGRKDPDSGREIWDDCILARRFDQFVPGKTVNRTVRLTAECVGQYCGGELECNLGVCVQPEQVQPDGGNAPPPDAEPPGGEDVLVPEDAPADAPGPADAGVDACSTDCRGSCNGTTGQCTVNCAGTNCTNRVVCGGDFNCTINCTSAAVCNGARCDTTKGCSFNCTGGVGNPRCPNIQCSAATCNVLCRDAERTCDGVSVDAAVNDVICHATDAGTPTCDDVECFGGICKRACLDGGLGCGPATRCSGNCEAWEDGGDGG